MEVQNSGVPGDAVSSVEVDQMERKLDEPVKPTLRQRIKTWLIVRALNKRLKLRRYLGIANQAAIIQNQQSLIEGLRADVTALSQAHQQAMAALDRATSEQIRLEEHLGLHRVWTSATAYKLARRPRRRAK